MTQPGEARESCDGQRDLDIFAYIFAHFHVPSSSPDTILYPACRVTKDYVSMHKAEKFLEPGSIFANGSVPVSLKRLSKIYFESRSKIHFAAVPL
jgi:hypothetical protein